MDAFLNIAMYVAVNLLLFSSWYILAPLWNREFSNRIIHIRSDIYNEWLKNLKDNKVTHVLIRTDSAEDKWIEKERKLLSDLRWSGAFKERFKVVYADENYKIMGFRQ